MGMINFLGTIRFHSILLVVAVSWSRAPILIFLNICGIFRHTCRVVLVKKEDFYQKKHAQNRSYVENGEQNPQWSDMKAIFVLQLSDAFFHKEYPMGFLQMFFFATVPGDVYEVIRRADWRFVEDLTASEVVVGSKWNIHHRLLLRYTSFSKNLEIGILAFQRSIYTLKK